MCKWSWWKNSKDGKSNFQLIAVVGEVSFGVVLLIKSFLLEIGIVCFSSGSRIIFQTLRKCFASKWNWKIDERWWRKTLSIDRSMNELWRASFEWWWSIATISIETKGQNIDREKDFVDRKKVLRTFPLWTEAKGEMRRGFFAKEKKPFEPDWRRWWADRWKCSISIFSLRVAQVEEREKNIRIDRVWSLDNRYDEEFLRSMFDVFRSIRPIEEEVEEVRDDIHRRSTNVEHFSTIEEDEDWSVL